MIAPDRPAVAAVSAMTMVQAVRSALAQEMAADERVVLLGQDIGRRGGVFLATDGLIERFGERRVIDTPLTEAGILGAALGMAMDGLRPIAEIQFVDFLFPGFDQLYGEIAKMRYRTAGEFGAPLVIRAPYGGGVHGGAYHSQSPEAIFAHMPGLKVVIPSDPAEAKGLLLAAIRDPDPVLFLEPKRIYRAIKSDVAEAAEAIPLGVARTVRAGGDVTLVAYGAMLQVTRDAAHALAEDGIDPEVIDLRTIIPYDGEAILRSVRKTGRLVVVVEAPKLGSFASEIAAFVAEEAIDSLEAPIVRVAAIDTSVPYNLERWYLPSAERIADAVRRVLAF